MINSAHQYRVSQLFDESVTYTIPRYQREYNWGKSEWDNLFDDIHDNDPGYFLGSIICINQSKDTLEPELELVDGQQRLTTLSLLFAAVYQALKVHKGELNDEQISDFINLQRNLILKKGHDNVRLTLQSQNNNHRDYCAVLADAGAIDDQEAPPYAGNRLLFRAYRHFKKRIAQDAHDQSTWLASTLELLEKANRSCLVKIEVNTHADAYTLFESLNNRGMPLTAIDLIKNRLLARLADNEPGKIDMYYNRWTKLLGFLGDDYAIQERFFRHYYNAFKNEFDEVIQVPVATRSNLIRIYQELINHDANVFLTKIIDAGRSYSVLLPGGQADLPIGLGKAIGDLDRIQGAPSHLLMLYLLLRRNQIELSNNHLTSIVELLVRFFVRRNVTDTPPTRDLTRLFMTAVDNIAERRADTVYQSIEAILTADSASDDVFQRALQGRIYVENRGATRFILYALAQQERTREKWADFWSEEKGKPLWTIEHVLPQGQNLPQPWIDMISDGDKAKAEEIQERHVHSLGNLTISAYNSNLGNMSFENKRDRRSEAGQPIGYKNGLKLNSDLATATSWSVDQIELRTATLVEQVLQLFKLHRSNS